MVDENEYYKKEMDKLQRSIDGINDKYNTLDDPKDLSLYNRYVQADLDYAPIEGELLKEYLPRLKVHLDFQRRKNLVAHRDGPKGPWYSHRHPLGCFMCYDLQQKDYLYNILQYVGAKYPDFKF